MKIKFLTLIITLLLILPTFIFFLGDKMFTFHDETQIANLHQYFKSLDFGQFPPRWAPDMHFEYGSPFLSFNYQLPYYVGYLGHLAGLPLTVIFKLLLALSVVIGAVGMFSLGLSLSGSAFFALTAAVLYAYTPYQAVDHFVRGTLGEVFALALFPWIFLSAHLLKKKETTTRVVVLGLLLALLIISHQPAALLAIPIFAFLFITKIKSFTKSLVIGLMISAYYWVPVIFEKGLIQTGGPFNYVDHFPFIKQLIYSKWTYSGSNPFSSDTLSFQIGLVNLLVLLIAAIIFPLQLLRRQKKGRDPLPYLLLLSTYGVIFLMNIRSSFIWERLSLLQSIQFPWRLLMFTTFFTSVLFLYVIKIIKKPWAKLFALAVIIATIALNFSYFRPGLIVSYQDDYYLRRFLPRAVLLPGETVSAVYLTHAEDYVPLPKNAIRPTSLPEAKLTIEKGNAKITVTDKNPYRYRAEVEGSKDGQLTFHTFAYPGWTVTVDGFSAKQTIDKIGAISFAVPSGKHQVVISYEDTPLRLFSNIISLGSFVFVASYLIYQLVSRHAATAARSSKSGRSGD